MAKRGAATPLHYITFNVGSAASGYHLDVLSQALNILTQVHARAYDSEERVLLLDAVHVDDLFSDPMLDDIQVRGLVAELKSVDVQFLIPNVFVYANGAAPGATKLWKPDEKCMGMPWLRVPDAE